MEFTRQNMPSEVYSFDQAELAFIMDAIQEYEYNGKLRKHYQEKTGAIMGELEIRSLITKLHKAMGEV